MRRIVIYGKGGIGKSTIASCLSVIYAEQGRRVLHVGCDPKQDSTLKLLADEEKTSVLDALMQKGRHIAIDDFVARGRNAIDCIEAGGPPPGAGCGGRGVARMFELFEELKLFEQRSYDVALFDVLGDVVCGGFAAPLRKGMGEAVYIVTSEEVMSLYAANNIARAIHRYAGNGVALGGLIFNLRDSSVAREALAAFATALNTRILAVLGRDPLVRQAEQAFATVVEFAPTAPITEDLRALAALLLAGPPTPPPPPTALDRLAFTRFIREHLTS
jgi:nitrogenase iron protein NifH